MPDPGRGEWMVIIGRNTLLALSLLLAGCAGLDRSATTAGEYPDEVYGRGGWSRGHDPYWGAHDPFYGPYGASGFGPYGYWGYPGWWGPPVYYVYPDRDERRPEAPRSTRLRPLQERMLRIAPVTPPRWTPPAPVRPLPSRDRGVFPSGHPDRLGSPPERRPWPGPAVPTISKPPPMTPPALTRPPPARMRSPGAGGDAPPPRRLWRRPAADGK